MANKKYDIPKDDAITVAESVPDDGIMIYVNVPTMGGYTFEALKHELTEFAKKLVGQNAEPCCSMSMDELGAKIQRGVEDYKNGRVVKKLQTESSEEFLNRLCTMSFSQKAL